MTFTEPIFRKLTLTAQIIVTNLQRFRENLTDGLMADTKSRQTDRRRGELIYLAPLGSENISNPLFQAVFLSGGGITPPD